MRDTYCTFIATVVSHDVGRSTCVRPFQEHAMSVRPSGGDVSVHSVVTFCRMITHFMLKADPWISRLFPEENTRGLLIFTRFVRGSRTLINSSHPTIRAERGNLLSHSPSSIRPFRFNDARSARPPQRHPPRDPRGSADPHRRRRRRLTKLLQQRRRRAAVLLPQPVGGPRRVLVLAPLSVAHKLSAPRQQQQ
jgi:hypothetical protein